MVYIDGVKYACERCIRGHRVTGCNHTNMPLTMIKPKGRPSTLCAHCKELKKYKSASAKPPTLKTKCTCPAKVKKTKPVLLNHTSTMSAKQQQHHQQQQQQQKQQHHSLLNGHNKLEDIRLTERLRPNSLFYKQDDVDTTSPLQFTLQKQQMQNGLNNIASGVFDDFLPPLVQMSNPVSQWPTTPSATTTSSYSSPDDFISDSSSTDTFFFDIPKPAVPGSMTVRSGNSKPSSSGASSYVDDFFGLNSASSAAPGSSGSPLLSSLEPGYQQPFLSLQHQQFQHQFHQQQQQQKLPPLDAISPALTVPGSFI